MKILLNQPRLSYYNGGGEQLPLYQAQALNELGHAVTILTSRPSRYTKFYQTFKDNNPNIDFIEAVLPELKFDYKSIEVGSSQSRWSIESLHFARNTSKLKQDLDADLIMNYYIFDGIFNTTGCNFLYLLGYAPTIDPAYESFLPFYDQIAAISKNTARIWQEQYNTKPIPSILPGVQIRLTEQNPFRSNAGLNIVFAGRLIERKGVRNLTQAVHQLLNNGYDLNLYILGEGPDRPWLEDYISHHQLTDNVHLLGHREDVHDYFAHCDLVILPSINKEGLMGTTLESLLAGAIVLTSTNNGNEEVISDGQNGFIKDLSNTEKIYHETKSLLNNLDTNQKLELRNNAHTSIKTLSWTNNAKSILKQLDLH